jgi:hypothetical protein
MRHGIILSRECTAQGAILEAETGSPTGTETGSMLILDFWTPGFQENKFLFFIQYPDCGFLLQQHEWSKTIINIAIVPEQSLLKLC